MEQLNAELAALRKRRDETARQAEQAADDKRRTDSLDELASRAAGRLAGMRLAERATVIRLLDVRVTVGDRTRTPKLLITGLPDGLWSVLGQECDAAQTSARRP